ncbi:RnaseH-domain-containing protein [Aspergillus uvarum CBS 121591]|uniref:Ribonuclease H n=1 Tax=Aspergillus uvarum CBS 121591 TaxID=1448315 RepID=A0A319CA73_9EURO|nr:RnaseH-domain-containing protein [Aspergillus uvarum CBS 121591]PYH75383.1 RnaseH-domain-containing protein [Aspergillus uvarum CBS 121591]
MSNTTSSPTSVLATNTSSRTSSSASTAGTKRKRNVVGKYYAVKAGYQPGVYYSWTDCLTQVTGYKGAVFQAFSSFDDAKAFLTGATVGAGRGGNNSSSDPPRYYGVQRGRVPGVYTDWSKAQEQIKGFTKPRYKKFATREEAEAFVNEEQANGATFAKAAKLSGAPGLTDAVLTDAHGVALEPGTGPLPPGTTDGFDPNVLLDPTTGKVIYKSADQKAATKLKSNGPPGMLRIYTDGSSLKNGRALASAGVGVYFGPGDSRNVSEPLQGSRQTNQRAELTAILRALEIAPRHRDVTIFTDSQYSIKSGRVHFVQN